MRFLSLVLCTSVLHSIEVFAAFRPDLRENVQVAELEPDQKVPDSATEIPMKAYPGSDFEIVFKCVEASKLLTFSDTKSWVACCLPGQKLLSTAEDTIFDCCEQDEDLVGNKTTGFRCCSSGLEFDGTGCRVPGKGTICPRGEIAVNDQCVCPPGTARSIDGACQILECSSGVQSGKCYTFTFENGYRFGYNTAGFYVASEENRAQQFGKFQLCLDENCTAITDINPGDGFSIKDIHGQANGGQNSKQWLNNAKDGDHITKTPDYSQAGIFAITKWPCGEYCLGGFDAGVGPTCPTEMVGATFTTQDDQSCIPVTLLEVPCDIRAPANNCIWDTKTDQCSSYREYAVPAAPIPSSQSPVSQAQAPTDEQVILNATISVGAEVTV
ncbi:hypothetical protein B7494_g4793 [Chlorociboria aeruginascens]|nr:hypothetical protein B7494_g4793 [Chlorociboria aeruginascens]